MSHISRLDCIWGFWQQRDHKTNTFLTLAHSDIHENPLIAAAGGATVASVDNQRHDQMCKKKNKETFRIGSVFKGKVNKDELQKKS